MYKYLKNEVFHANMNLVKNDLVLFTWGNASGIDRELGAVAIKPSGVSYEEMKPSDIVVVDLDGKIIEGDLKPSSDTPTHLELYRSFNNIGGVVHTHAEWGTSWAQAGKAIPAYGTTHADYFYGPIPCTRILSEEEVLNNYELNTGKVIVQTFEGLDPDAIPSVLVNGHAPFSWGKSPDDAVNNAVVLEYIAKMAFRNQVLGKTEAIDQFLLDKHYLRRHGKDAYYGQK